jgi:hypothetical protein
MPLRSEGQGSALDPAKGKPFANPGSKGSPLAVLGAEPQP